MAWGSGHCTFGGCSCLFRENFTRLTPAQPTVYLALAERLTLLPAQHASAVIAFYGALDWARSLVGELPRTQEFSEARGGHLERQAASTLERLKQATSGAAFNATLAIRRLDELAAH